ncbi:MAG: hypothetical protein GY949_12475 [Gammaproteobacteria bacterium]|nr:hypothetical protein [Gammaproteobacteria bacterium]
MTTELILHIGANKTGSSALQSFMRMNEAVLRDHGFVLPDRELSFGGHVSGYQVFAMAEMFNQAGDGLDAAFDHLMKNRGGRVVLASAENMSNADNYEYFKRICGKYKTRVIFYVRRQDELITASWQQWHSKRQRNIHKWLDKAKEEMGHWEQTYLGWQQVAGEGSVDLRVFERDSFPQGNISHDFLQALGIPDEARGDFTFEQQGVNPTYNDFITPLVAGNSRIFKDVHDNDFYKFVGEMTGSQFVGGRKYSLITRRERNEIMLHYKRENARLCRRALPGRAELFSPIDHSRYVYASPEQIQGEQLRFVTALLYGMYQKSQE